MKSSDLTFDETVTLQSLAKIKPRDIRHAAHLPDLDTACRYLQEIAGITDGGVAALVFSDVDFEWADASLEARQYKLREWLAHERFDLRQQFTNKITIKHGSEGPKHDPYAFTEITVDGRAGPTTYHSGLAEWASDGITKVHAYATTPNAAREFFTQRVGITPEDAEISVRRHREHLITAHLRKCKGHLHSADGYPGETFEVCSVCGDVLDSHFDESAVI